MDKRGVVSGLLLRIVSRHFVAGVVAYNNVVTEAAPILAYMRGWSTLRVWEYCTRKGWSVEPC